MENYKRLCRLYKRQCESKEFWGEKKVFRLGIRFFEQFLGDFNRGSLYFGEFNSYVVGHRRKYAVFESPSGLADSEIRRSGKNEEMKGRGVSHIDAHFPSLCPARFRSFFPTTSATRRRKLQSSAVYTNRRQLF